MNASEHTMAVELLFGVLACVAYAAAAASLREHRKRGGEGKSGDINVWMTLSFLFLGSLYFARVLLVQFFPSFVEDYRQWVDLLWLLPSLILALTGLCRKRNPAKTTRYSAYMALGLILVALGLQGLFSTVGAFICGQLLIMGGQGLWYYFVLRKPPERGLLYPCPEPEPDCLGEAPQQFISQPVEALFEEDVDLDDFYTELNERLLRLFEQEKPYLTPRVNLREVAGRMGTNKTYVSALLNRHLNQNFNQFVNGYRVREAQDYVKHHGRVDLPQLCRLVGFLSMASFTVAFRLNTGMTPGEWCRQYKIVS